MSQTPTDPPKIEFPCDYPIKVLGRAGPDFKDVVVEIIERHGDLVVDEVIKVRESRGGKFLSVTVTIVATGVDQLEAIHGDLQASGRVQMVI